jgi:hypothetical protein
MEAESMILDGYTVSEVTPWEAASGGKVISCAAKACTASLHYDGAPGWYAMRVQYFDQDNGVSRFRLWVNAQLVDEWKAADHLPSRKIDAGSSYRRLIPGVALRPGDQIRIEGAPDGAETAAIDFLEIHPQGN